MRIPLDNNNTPLIYLTKRRYHLHINLPFEVKNPIQSVGCLNTHAWSTCLMS
jgi:hypothetical protein